MKPERALEIMFRAMLREVLSSPEDAAGEASAAVPSEPARAADFAPIPRLDFVPESDPDVYAQNVERMRAALEQEAEMDPLLGAVPPPAGRSRADDRLFPEDMPMRGLDPPGSTR